MEKTMLRDSVLRIRSCFRIDVGQRQDASRQVRFDRRPSGREQHDKKCQASRTDRDCGALNRSSVVAPLLAGESGVCIS